MKPRARYENTAKRFDSPMCQSVSKHFSNMFDMVKSIVCSSFDVSCKYQTTWMH